MGLPEVLQEVRKLIEYSDKRDKAIVYTMISSDLRLGAWDYLQRQTNATIVVRIMNLQKRKTYHLARTNKKYNHILKSVSARL
jgi:hypothetical protein